MQNKVLIVNCSCVAGFQDQGMKLKSDIIKEGLLFFSCVIGTNEKNLAMQLLWTPGIAANVYTHGE